MLRACKYCGRVHPTGYLCPKKPARRKEHTPQKDLRSTSRWTRKSLEIRERDFFLCRVCLEKGVVNRSGIEVHHIIPLEENEASAFDNGWLISLCGKDHERAERGEISREHLHRMASGGPPTLPAVQKED